MYSLKIPEGYKSSLDLRETQKAIQFVKDTFQKNFIKNFAFERVSAPMMVESKTGINDNLSGVERPVTFDLKEQNKTVEIVHSLAKWKRIALREYNFGQGEGIYTDMNAIRRDDSCDNIHSVYVDQWDWEMVISDKQRSEDFLKMIVRRIVQTIIETLNETKKKYPIIKTEINSEVKFISSEEALQMYPDLTEKERENELAKNFGTVFLMHIGGNLLNGKPHDTRSPDYDDWKLNGDLLFYNKILGESLELSSMGIRVNKDSLLEQLKLADKEERLKNKYHRDIVEDKLPLTIGGGIGQSRHCMLILEKAHIGEVQASIWPDEMREECKAHNIQLL